MTKYDDLWTDTTQYANLANVGALARQYPTYPMNPELNFPPDGDYEDRLVSAMSQETQAIDVVMFRITSGKLPEEMIRRAQAGVPIRLITDRRQYRNRAYFWHSYNIDRMFAAGIPIKWKVDSTDQDMHQKSVVLYGRNMAVFGSSNWTGSSSDKQREHNYFTSKSWFVDVVRRAVSSQMEQPADRRDPHHPDDVPRLPAWLARDSCQRHTGERRARRGGHFGHRSEWEGGWWAHKYDVHFGTTNPPPLVAQDYMPGAATAGVRSTKESFNPCAPPPPFASVCPSGLSPGTTYYWMIRGKTMLGDARRITGPVWSFTTSATISPTLSLDKTSLRFGATTTGTVFAAWTGAQDVRLTQNGPGSMTWTATPTQPWIQVTPSSGTGPANLSISVAAVGGLPLSGSVAGGVQLNFTGAADQHDDDRRDAGPHGSRLVPCPFGNIDRQRTFGQASPDTVPFTGWAVDDIEVTRVMICREAVGAEVAQAESKLRRNGADLRWNCRVSRGRPAGRGGAVPDVPAERPRGLGLDGPDQHAAESGERHVPVPDLDRGS